MPSDSVNTGVGCLPFFPAALVGFAGLTDGIGPKGWRGISQLSGWLIVCLIAAVLLGRILTRSNRTGAFPYTLTLAIVAAMAALAYEALNWLGLEAPLSVKTLFTSSMQFFGAVGLIACAAVFFKAAGEHIWR